jgi:hypothetical protein
VLGIVYGLALGHATWLLMAQMWMVVMG